MVVTARIQTYTVAIIPAVLLGLEVIISAGMTTTADGQAAMDQEKINRLLEQVVKALDSLDSGDIAAAEEYLNEIDQGLPTGQAKTHLAIAINNLRYSNDTEGARMHIQIVQSSLQNSTGWLLIAALGMSLAYIPMLTSAISNTRKEQTGLASGLVNTSYQVGSALGLAIIVAIASSQTETLENIGLPSIEALNDGFHSAFIVGAIISVIATAVAIIGLKMRVKSSTERTIAETKN